MLTLDYVWSSFVVVVFLIFLINCYLPHQQQKRVQSSIKSLKLFLLRNDVTTFYLCGVGGLEENTFYVDYRTEDGSANAGSDYDYSEGTLVFKPGDTRKEIKVSSLEGFRRCALLRAPPGRWNQTSERGGRMWSYQVTSGLGFQGREGGSLVSRVDFHVDLCWTRQLMSERRDQLVWNLFSLILLSLQLLWEQREDRLRLSLMSFYKRHWSSVEETASLNAHQSKQDVVFVDLQTVATVAFSLTQTAVLRVRLKPPYPPYQHKSLVQWCTHLDVFETSSSPPDSAGESESIRLGSVT